MDVRPGALSATGAASRQPVEDGGTQAVGFAWSVALRELRGGLAGFRVFLACLILGVMGIAAVGSVTTAIEKGLAAEGRNILGGDAALEQALLTAWTLPRPEPTRFSQSGDMRAVQAAPDQMLLIFPQDTPDARAQVDARLGGTGYTTDQTDVWVVLELEGATVRAALERMCLLDVQSFTPGFAARTVMEHMSAWVICLEPDRFWLMSASSSAGSFLHAVETSCRNVAGG